MLTVEEKTENSLIMDNCSALWMISKALSVSETTISNCFMKCGSRVEQQEAVADNSEGVEDFSGWDKFMRNLEDGLKQ